MAGCMEKLWWMINGWLSVWLHDADWCWMSIWLHFKVMVRILCSEPPGLIKQFLRDVDWGEVDYLLVDTPPGTSDEHLSIVQYLSATHVDGAVVITTPQVASTERFSSLALIIRVSAEYSCNPHTQ